MYSLKEILRKRKQIYTESEFLSKLQDLTGGSVQSNVSPSEMCALAIATILAQAAKAPKTTREPTQEELAPRSEIPPVKYARIQGSHFGRNFHGKCKIPWKSVSFVGNSNKKMVYECNSHHFCVISI